MAAPRNRFSIVVLARDAAHRLRLTLASVRDIADEIVVADTGSTDDTRQVAREFGTRLVELPWTDDFAAARNTARDHATGDWLLWLDAGETLEEGDARALKAFAVEQARRDSAYLLTIRLAPQHAGASPEQIARPRLLPAQPKIDFAGRVWESPLASIKQHGMRLEGLPFLLHRGERDHEPRVKKQRAQRNLRLAEIELNEGGHQARLWNCLGDALVTLGEPSRAAESFRSALALAERGSPEALEAYYGVLTSRTADERDVQLRECIEALESFPVDAQLLCALGGYLQASGKLQVASQSYLTAFKFGQVNPTLWHLSEVREVAAVCHALTLQLLDRVDESVRFLEDAVAERPESARIRRRLIEFFVQQGARDSALAHAGALPAETPHLEAFRSAVRGACFASQRNLIAGKAYLNAAFAHGCRDSLCLKWLAVCLASTGDLAEARRVLQEWERLDPRNSDLLKLLEKIGPAPGSSTAAATVPSASPLFRFDAATAAGTRPAAPVMLNLPALESR